MKAIEKNLYKRNKSFYYRSSLPRDLHSLLPFKEIVFSIGNIDTFEARILCAKINQKENTHIKNSVKPAEKRNFRIKEIANSEAAFEIPFDMALGGG